MASDPNSPERFDPQPISVPIVREHLIVDKERIETGRVRIAKQIREELQMVEVPVAREEVNIERVTLHRPIEAVPPVRHEGDTLVIPVVREELVVEKRLVLVEEIRITRRVTEATHSQEVTLRQEELVIDRKATGSDVRE